MKLYKKGSIHYYVEGEQAFNVSGQLIGNTSIADKLVVMGINPEFASEASWICTVGYCAERERWCGFIFNESGVGKIGMFGIGDTMQTVRNEIQLCLEKQILFTTTSLVQDKFIARTPADCRLLACMFATAVE